VRLHRRGHGVEQRAVAPGQAALGMADLAFGGLRGVEVESLAQLLQRRVARRGRQAGVGMGNVVEQLAGRLERGFRAWDAEAVVLELQTRLAQYAGEGLAQAGRWLQRTVAQCRGDGTGYPQLAPRLVLLGPHVHRVDARAYLLGILRWAVLGPLG